MVIFYGVVIIFPQKAFLGNVTIMVRSFHLISVNREVLFAVFDFYCDFVLDLLMIIDNATIAEDPDKHISSTYVLLSAISFVFVVALFYFSMTFYCCLFSRQKARLYFVHVIFGFKLFRLFPVFIFNVVSVN